MDITQDTIVGELVAEDYRTASIFKQNGIDFCCNGNRSIQAACEKKQLDASGLIAALREATKKHEGTAQDFKTWPLDLLADYIEKKHHSYVEAKIQEIMPYLERIAQVHGDRHGELIEVAQLFHDSGGEFTVHMKKEELMLFPQIRKLAKAKHDNAAATPSPMGTVQNPIRVMLHDHDTEGERWRRIAELTHDYNPPSDACNTYRVAFALLKEFEDDLHMHIHLENNILFPKAIELEGALVPV